MSEEQSLSDRIVAVLEEVRPALQADGGDVQFVGFNEETGVVQVRLQGACSHCPASTYTLHMAIEQRLKEVIPEVKGIDNVP